MNIPVFLSADNNYAPFVATTMASILDNTNSYIDFYILDSGITEENQEKIKELKNKFDNFSVEFLRINTEKEFSNIEHSNSGNNSYITIATYNRLLIPKLKPDLKKIIYLDCDVVALSDIKELYDIDLEGCGLGACWNISYKNKALDEKKNLEMSDDMKYFNAGVLLIDIQKWIDDDVVSKLYEIEQKYRGKFLNVDQSILNKYFDGNYKIIDIKFNGIDSDCILNSPKNIVIRHYASSDKPWHFLPDILGDIYPNLNDFWHYAEMTAFTDDIKKCVKPLQEHNKMRLKLRAYKIMGQKNK